VNLQHAASAIAALVLVGGAVLVACDLEVDTHYGPHSGLSKGNLPNPPVAEAGGGDGGATCGMVVDAGACSVSYATQIWPKMSGTWHCSDANCHGAMVNEPYNLDNATDAYNNLMAFMQINNVPYINPCSTSPDASAFLCNVQSPACGSAQMPFPDSTLGSGPMSTSDVQLVQTWVECGAPMN
jgi:hypothetical protein